MTFLKDDEFLLLMNHCKYRTRDTNDDPYHILTVGERAILNACGIQTAHEQPAWNSVEPSKGQYNFDYLDEIVKMNRDAGLKTLFQISGWRPPKWMPNDWFAKTEAGVVDRETLSFWNEEAQQHSDKYYRDMVDYYAPQRDVAFFFGEFQGGEGAYPPSSAFFDRAALDDYHSRYGNNARPDIRTQETLDWFGEKIIDHFFRKCTILYSEYGEMWNCQQYLMDTWSKAFGNYVQPKFMQDFRSAYPDANIVLLQYTYFDSSHDEHNVQYVDMLRSTTGCEVIAEAMFCEGLKTTTPKSIDKGFRGQIIHPARKSFEDGHLEDWMIEEIKKSNDLWKASKER